MLHLNGAEMLNPKYKRYAERIIDLIHEGDEVAKLERPSSGGSYIQDKDKIKLHSWLTKVTNILELVFGSNSPQYRNFQENLPGGGLGFVEHSYEIFPIIGVLVGALDDLEKGYLLGQEFIVVGEVFDSILEQAEMLLKSGFKDPAAVLARVVLEDSLKRLARSMGSDESKKASQINDELKRLGTYSQPQWRLVQAWLDIGNAAAHGKFSEYDNTDVTNQINGVKQFLASHLYM
jgi:hypothetical protein